MQKNKLDPKKYADVSPKLLSGRVYPEFFTLPPASRVVNIGCGRGPQMVVYQGQFEQFIGVDLNQERLDRMQQLAREMDIQGSSVILKNAEATGLESGAFDVVLAIDIIEHVESPEAMLVASAFFRISSPAGFISFHQLIPDNIVRPVPKRS